MMKSIWNFLGSKDQQKFDESGNIIHTNTFQATPLTEQLGITNVDDTIKPVISIGDDTKTVTGTGDESGDGSGKGGFNDPEFWKQIKGMQGDALAQSKDMMYGKMGLNSLNKLSSAHTARGLADAEGHSNLQRTLAATYAAGKKPQFLTDMRYAGPNVNYRFLG